MAGFDKIDNVEADYDTILDDTKTIVKWTKMSYFMSVPWTNKSILDMPKIRHFCQSAG